MMQSPQVDDHQLVQALVHEYYPGLLRFGVLQLGSGALADQVAKNTIWTAVHNRHRYWGDPAFKVWIYSLAQKSIQGREPKQPALSAIFDQAQAPTTHSSQTEDESPFEAALNQLSNKQKLILLLRYADRFSIHEVGQIFGMSQRSAQQQLHRARETLLEDRKTEGKLSGSHRLFTRQIQTGIDGYLKVEEQEELKQHLWGCQDCQLYASQLEQLEKQFSRLVPQIWPALPPPEGEAQVVFAIEENVEEQSRNRLFTANFKEMAFVSLIVFVVLVIGIIARVTSPSDPAQSQQGLAIADALQTATPASVTPRAGSASPPGGRALPSTGDQYPWHTYNQRNLPDQFDLVVFDNLLKSPASRLKVSGINQTGPASLAMALKYWSRSGNAFTELQPNSSDPAVMPYEILNYVKTKTDLKAIQRSAGDLDTIKKLVYAGIPVIVETGIYATSYQPWSGQYEIVTGYNEDWNSIKVVASYDIPGVYADIYYDDFLRDWHAFNYLYIVVYPTSVEDKVDRILGENADSTKNLNYAASQALSELKSNDGPVTEFFSWFNAGASYAQLNEPDKAANMFDKAFALMDQIPSTQRPSRILWYQPYPYWAYFYSGRYQDVIDLATQALADQPDLEESYYWRALAEEALGQRTSAQRDLNRALDLNPNFKPGIAQLAPPGNGS